MHNPKFKLGEMVRCVLPNEHSVAGMGWALGFEFIINQIVNSDADACYFEGRGGGGVYENYLERVFNNEWKGRKK